MRKSLRRSRFMSTLTQRVSLALTLIATLLVMIMGGRMCVRFGHLARASGAFRRGNQSVRNSITLFTLRRCCGVCSAR